MAWKGNSISPTLLFTTGLLVLSAFNYGFSDQAFSSGQAMDSFARQFGVYHPKTDTWKVKPLFTSLFNSLKAGGQLIGVFIGGYVSNTYGRRMCVFSMNVYALGSAAVLISSTTVAQIQAGRVLHYVYLGMQLAVIPTALTELAPAQVRGGICVLYWLSIKVGGLVVTSIARGTSSIQTDAAWRIPFGLILVVPSIVLSLIWFTPESPRWLLLRDRHAEALESLVRLRPKDASKEQTEADFQDLSDKVAVQLQKKQFRDLFTRQNRRRTFIVVACNFFQQATGQAFASQYGTLFVKQLKSINPFSVTLGINAIDIGAICVSALSIDKVGRRALFHVSSSFQTIALMTMGGLGTADSSDMDAKKGIVAMLMLFSFSWSLGWAPLVYVLGAELPASPLREKTLQIAYTVKLVTEFAVTFSYPYLETADTPHHVYLGGKLGFIYGSLSAVAFVFGWFFIPETRRLELEDIDKKFVLPKEGVVALETAADKEVNIEERTTE
ncbi:general substrate transporter [Penicillium chermesinum]|uniref:General substrate transporter n=1 Tax=Penicillium chermesinum TaxID=63820 RepID=A0A9W9PGY1_9EURO|nr:general substrate transporter [Penicillium chermesinum]KAJ5246633.1 general substrate transporter [Penicillium chermesinum]KAJ6144905.1 general substrate transporter [Penicillium chermesinum]